ncbi:MAG: sugar transferase, partial [Bacillota bacterium]|nr:sugar transferase [Bacillota bacterium]
SWEKKFEYDAKYINQGISLRNDLKIIIKTITKVIKRSDVVRAGTASDMDFGDWLLHEQVIGFEEYELTNKAATSIVQN